MNCDGTVRINGDQDGNAFVYSKEATTTNNAEGGDDEDTAATPTSYKTVSADLGLLHVLGGFNDAITKFYIWSSRCTSSSHSCMETWIRSLEDDK